jgi:hypothetical protein
MITRMIKVMVAPEGTNLFDLGVFFVEIDDEAGGEFVKVKQNLETGDAGIEIDPKDWRKLREAIDDMVKFCREEA